ncbi:MAG: spore germination protein [Ruminococcaceae bacterium]|nr:spore germination protein [Oscillospiraceae bacterium]
MNFSINLDENITRLRKQFQGNCMIVFRHLENAVSPQIKGTAIFSDGLVGASLVNDYVVKPFVGNTLLKEQENKLHFLQNSVFQSNDVVIIQNNQELVQRLFSGDVIFFLNGYHTPLAVNARFPATRTVSEPENEKTLKGPREGFCELILFNTALIMRRLKNEHLKLENFTLGTQTKTTVIMAYIEGLCHPELIEQIRCRLNAIKTDGLTDTNQLAELLKDKPLSPFKTTGSTERPDVVCHKLMEGRIAILADGTPQVITLPFLFHEYFSSTDDYSVNFYYGSISRLLRYISFLIAVFLPAIYLAAVKFQLEILPEKLLYSISSSRMNVPFSATVELLIFFLFFEILREASTRTPSAIGQTLSIAGALILGQTAVEANFISVPAIIIVAISGLCTNVLPQMRGPLILLRLMILIGAAFLGIYGVVLGAIALIVHLSDITVSGENYLSEMIPQKRNLWDIYIRGPYRFLKRNKKEKAR